VTRQHSSAEETAEEQSPRSINSDNYVDESRALSGSIAPLVVLGSEEETPPPAALPQPVPPPAGPHPTENDIGNARESRENHRGNPHGTVVNGGGNPRETVATTSRYFPPPSSPAALAPR